MSGDNGNADAGRGTLIRAHKASFGPYLRSLRLQRGLSLRDAAGQIGITFAKLQKMETGGRFRLDGLDLLLALADLYGRPRAEVLHEAGIQVVMPENLEAALDIDRAFAALVLHPDLRPTRMDLAWTESFSALQKAQWMEFARKLAAVPEPARLVERVVAGAAGGEDDA
jgi:transcriptional regulator with XRE-family HTH domain